MINTPKFFGADGKRRLYMQFRVMQYRDGINYPLKTFWTDRPVENINPANVYFFAPGLRDFSKTIVKGSFAAWIDLDTRDIPRWHREPSLIIDTGHGHHVYWLLSDFCPPEELAQTLTNLCNFYKSDPKVRDVTRFMRMPESYNQKFQPAHFCKIIHQDDKKRYNYFELTP